MCLSQCSIAVKRYHGQGNAYEKASNCGFVYIFRGVVHYHHNGDIGSMKAGAGAISCHRQKEQDIEPSVGF